MTSSLSWLDVSAEQQRRVREIISLFEVPGTRDELGIGSVRDSFSETLFPGTSVIQTRARYFLFVPWHFQAGARRGLRGADLLAFVDRQQRQLIKKFKQGPSMEGLIGRVAGERVKTLPSTIYWNGLTRLGILTAPMTARTVATMSVAVDDEPDELSLRRTGAWHPTLPAPPAGFPDADSGGFALTAEEASWLEERILNRASGTLLASLVNGQLLSASATPWEEPATLEAPSEPREVLDLARRFSSSIHGAALLFNLLIAEKYEAAGFTRFESPTDEYRGRLAVWSTTVADSLADSLPDPNQLWDLAAKAGQRVPPSTRQFIEHWLRLIGDGRTAQAADRVDLRSLVAGRVAKLRGPRSLLANEKLLAQWGGTSGSDPLVYRWGTVHRLVLDIQEGLARAVA